MNSTGERFLLSQSGMIEFEHLSRYYFVNQNFNLNNKVVLDIASGEGYGSNLLSEKAKYVYGIDISSEAIDYAKKKYCKNNLKFLQGDITKIPIESKSIDVIISFETIEHIEEQETMLLEFKRVLKESGIVIISTPDKDNFSKNSNGENIYHKKELSINEFYKLVDAYFKFKLTFIQSSFFGSFILPSSVNQEDVRPFLIDGLNEPSHIMPMFNIAIASDMKIDFEIHPLYYTNAKKYKIVTQEFIDNIYSSYTWKTGTIILKPFSKLKKLFRSENE
jgi:ubiquinone/menaquinone biosynthesis C-methylase UbiE